MFVQLDVYLAVMKLMDIATSRMNVCKYIYLLIDLLLFILFFETDINGF